MKNEGPDFPEETELSDTDLLRRDIAFIESLPTKEEFQALLRPFGLDVITYRDEPKLYLMVAQKQKNQGDSEFRSAESLNPL